MYDQQVYCWNLVICNASNFNDYFSDYYVCQNRSKVVAVVHSAAKKGQFH